MRGPVTVNFGSWLMRSLQAVGCVSLAVRRRWWTRGRRVGGAGQRAAPGATGRTQGREAPEGKSPVYSGAG